MQINSIGVDDVLFTNFHRGCFSSYAATKCLYGLLDVMFKPHREEWKEFYCDPDDPGQCDMIESYHLSMNV